MSNLIELRPVKNLLGMNFFIPEYQRGYRWKTRQVLDLLEDIKEFIENKNKGKYCLQPLVVKCHEPDDSVRNNAAKALQDGKSLPEIRLMLQDQWDVVDGQQRLTTIYILLKYLQVMLPYNLCYATREKSQDFLKNLNEENTTDNIDFTYIYNAHRTVVEFFKNKNDKYKELFLNTILNQTEFIWYEIEEEPIEVFTRLNIGKISLTNSELVKALLLNKANFTDSTRSLNEVALVWDRIEYALQNDRFWCFIHEDGHSQPTRIDFLLKLVEKLRNHKTNKKPKKQKNGQSQNKITQQAEKWSVEKKDLGNDNYKTFRYFYHLLNRNGVDSSRIWEELVGVFNLLNEWYNDNECYHYIGFLTTTQDKGKNKSMELTDLIRAWEGTKNAFIEKLRDQIKKSINNIKDLDKQYEIEVNNQKGISKTKCFPLLLLFNIQTIVDKNNLFKNSKKFNALSFERFPFDLLKKEKGWDIEHIASNTDNALYTNKEAIDWLKLAMQGIEEEERREEIKNIISNYNNEDNKETTDELRSLCDSLEKSNLNSQEKNKIWNFCLLDQATNRGYGNSIFAVKRKWIINREMGLDIEGNTLNEKNVYLPLCTLRVFTKFYNPSAKDLSSWGKEDAIAYKKAISNTLDKFIN